MSTSTRTAATVVMRPEDPAPLPSANRLLVPLDRSIVAAMATDPKRGWRPVEVAQMVKMPVTHPIAVRIRLLTNKGLLTRVRMAGAPANGPGASFYLISDEGLAVLRATDAANEADADAAVAVAGAGVSATG